MQCIRKAIFFCISSHPKIKLLALKDSAFVINGMVCEETEQQLEMYGWGLSIE